MNTFSFMTYEVSKEKTDFDYFLLLFLLVYLCQNPNNSPFTP